MAENDERAKDGPGGAADPLGDEGRSSLEGDLEAARAEAQRNQERWLRERADLENLKKRAMRERAETVKFANEQVLKDLLPVVDNLERALAHARERGEAPALVEGVELVLKAFLAALERHGVKRIATAGARFDPAHHEAMAQVESAAHEPHAVVEEHQPGYLLHERLLRPALVSVAKPPPGGPDLANKDPRG